MVVGTFDPYERMPELPDYAPSRALHMNNYPGEAEWTQRLRAAGIDPTSAGAIIAAIVKRGWSFWLVGATHAPKPPRYRAMVLEPRYHAMWATSGDQLDPVSAFAQVMAICLACPPWERDEG